MKRVAALSIVVVAAAVSALAQGTSTWQIDPAHANAQFVVRHLGISNVQGQFTHVTGTIQLNDQDITKSAVNASIDINSLDTRVKDRDDDLKSPNYFDTAKYPTMTFQSKRFAKGSDGSLQMTGDLTLHGVTKEVTFVVDGPTDAIKDPWGNQRRGASATTKIKRSDFGMSHLIGPIGDEVKITLDVEFIKKS